MLIPTPKASLERLKLVVEEVDPVHRREIIDDDHPIVIVMDGTDLERSFEIRVKYFTKSCGSRYGLVG